MRFIKNQIHVRIVSFIICCVFLLDNIAYGIDISALRIPLICNVEEEHMPSPNDLSRMIYDIRNIAAQDQYNEFDELAQREIL